MGQENKTIEARIDESLEKIRPFLQREGGDIKLDHYDKDTGICYVDMVGACAGCVLAASDVSDSIEVMLMDEVPEIKKVELIAPTITAEESFDDLLRRLQAEQQATLELEKINKEKAQHSEDDESSK